MTFEFINHSVDLCCYMGICLNAILIYLAYKHSMNMGLFKYFLIIFSGFEFLFAILVLLDKPMFLGFNHRLMVISQNTWMPHEILKFVNVLYCSFYQIWLGLVVILFAYKYIVMCKSYIAQKIKYNIWPKVLILVVYLLHVSYTLVCGLIWCSTNKPTKYMIQRIRDLFAADSKLTGKPVHEIAVASFLNEQNEVNVAGFFSVVDHLVLITSSFTIIVFCGCQIWTKLRQMEKETRIVDYKRNVQIFYTIVLQAGVPFTLYNLPTAIFMGDAVIQEEPILVDWIPLWSLLMSLPKVIDPMIVMFMIKDYRMALRRFIFGASKIRAYIGSQTEATRRPTPEA